MIQKHKQKMQTKATPIKKIAIIITRTKIRTKKDKDKDNKDSNSDKSKPLTPKKLNLVAYRLFLLQQSLIQVRKQLQVQLQVPVQLQPQLL